jgi:spore coat protein CotH
MSSSNIRFLIVLLAIVFSVDLNSQNEFYDTESIREIHINFFDENWDHLLDSLYVEGENGRILADIAIDGEIYPNVGVRYKGFSSVSVNNIKNPFNIKLDYVIEDQNHQGLDKLKLSNVIQDPSFVREVLSYEICRKYMPASGANFAKLYIN